MSILNFARETLSKLITIPPQSEFGKWIWDNFDTFKDIDFSKVKEIKLLEHSGLQHYYVLHSISVFYNDNIIDQKILDYCYEMLYSTNKKTRMKAFEVLDNGGDKARDVLIVAGLYDSDSMYYSLIDSPLFTQPGNDYES